VGWLLATRIETQSNELSEQLSRGTQQARDFLQRQPWGRQIQFDESDVRRVFASGGLMGNIGGVLSSSLGVVVDVIVVLALAIYLAINPARYKQGLVHLLPLDQRARARDTLEALGTTLRWWLVGRLLSMLEVGVLTGIGLWLLGVPLPMTLGVITGLMNFVPNFGPVLATLVTGLVGLSVSPTVAIYAVGAQLVIGGIDGFVVTPLIQQRSVAVPAGVILGAQVLVGILLGGLGVMVATPLAAAGYVLVKKLYVNDMLGDESV
jgi:predicted PurR-regulated permease PerM